MPGRTPTSRTSIFYIKKVSHNNIELRGVPKSPKISGAKKQFFLASFSPFFRLKFSNERTRNFFKTKKKLKCDWKNSMFFLFGQFDAGLI